MKQKMIRSKYSEVKKLIILCFVILLTPGFAHAHRGANVDEVDQCRIKVGYEWIHFSAYTPNTTGGKTYCEAIPDIGQTNLVFDYEGKKLRNVTIEFEITKEPDGTRVFYQEPKKIKSGSMNALVDFSKYGAGDYLAHITIVHKGEKLDQHIPFVVGQEEELKINYGKLLLILTLMIVIGLFLYTLYKANDDKTEKSSEN